MLIVPITTYETCLYSNPIVLIIAKSEWPLTTCFVLLLERVHSDVSEWVHLYPALPSYSTWRMEAVSKKDFEECAHPVILTDYTSSRKHRWPLLFELNDCNGFLHYDWLTLYIVDHTGGWKSACIFCTSTNFKYGGMFIVVGTSILHCSIEVSPFPFFKYKLFCNHFSQVFHNLLLSEIFKWEILGVIISYILKY